MTTVCFIYPCCSSAIHRDELRKVLEYAVLQRLVDDADEFPGQGNDRLESDDEVNMLSDSPMLPSKGIRTGSRTAWSGAPLIRLTPIPWEVNPSRNTLSLYPVYLVGRQLLQRPPAPGVKDARPFHGLPAHEHSRGRRNTVGENLRHLVRNRWRRCRATVFRDGLAYDESTRDTAAHLFFDGQPNGAWVIEYSVRMPPRGR